MTIRTIARNISSLAHPRRLVENIESKLSNAVTSARRGAQIISNRVSGVHQEKISQRKALGNRVYTFIIPALKSLSEWSEADNDVLSALRYDTPETKLTVRNACMGSGTLRMPGTITQAIKQVRAEIDRGNPAYSDPIFLMSFQACEDYVLKNEGLIKKFSSETGLINSLPLTERDVTKFQNVLDTCEALLIDTLNKSPLTKKMVTSFAEVEKQSNDTQNNPGTPDWQKKDSAINNKMAFALRHVDN